MRLRPWPNKSLYIENLIGVINTVNSEQNFEALHEGFEGLLDLRNQRRFLSYLERSLVLFKDDLLFKSNVVEWRFSNQDYHFEFDSVLKARFDKTGDLICYSMGDSIAIRQTSGVLYLDDQRWVGGSGKYTWERVNLSPDSIYAEFDSYDIDLTRARFNIDSVRFTNSDFFSEPLKGQLQERIVSGIRPENARYPRFTSYQAVLNIEDLFPNIDYVGGFTLSGQRVLGTSAENQSAVINIYRNDSLFVTARADVFSIRGDRIISERAAVSIYMAGDSVYHPGINMRYLHDNTEFSLIRDERGFSRAPFHNTYHKLDMYCEAVYWNIKEPKIEFRMSRGFSERGEAVFESNDFFSEIRYVRLQGLDNIHPLVRLSRYSREIDSKEFSVKDYARHIRIDPNSVLLQLINLSYFGFVSIDVDEETVVLNDRLYHYIGALSGRNDYDVMNLTSKAHVNAVANLHNFDLKINGVERIPLSDAKNVIIHPYGQTVTMQKNRDIYFHGRIESGLFDFYGREFFFDYDEFKIDLINTDSMSFRVRSFEPDSRGQYSYVRVRTVLEGINGELLVDHPDNKSGNLPYPRYPIFNSDNESYVYYDREFIHSGAYRREDVYFRIIPFSIDSLDHATTENIAFDGVFISTGIFPEFYDYLTVQPDYSLGFNTHTPEEGYPIYDGKARYHGPIDMSYEGLTANGKLEYLNATVEADKMLMFLDSARAEVNTFTLRKQDKPIDFPSVSASDVDMLYLPFEDELAINSIDEPIDIYDGLAMVEGGVTVTPGGLDGFGSVGIFEGKMVSENYSFRHNELEAFNTTVEFRTPDKEKVNLSLNEYEALVDVDNRKGNFKASDVTSHVELPVNQYISFMDELDWDHNEQQLLMYNQRGRNNFDLEGITKDELIDTDFEGYEFISTHRRQDSLRFYVDNAVFDQQNSQIHARGVNIIKVADAAIFPDNDEVFILPEAEIKKLKKASLIADTSKRYHEMYNAEIDISSRKYFEGKAWYDYKNETGDVHELFFEKLSVNDQGRTFGLSKVYKENEFYVTTQFPFKGDINMLSTEQHFNYEGATRILADECGLLEPVWFRFEAVLAPDSVMIPIEENLRSANYTDLRTAVMLAGDSLHIYPAIFSRRNHYLDQEIISASGYLSYDRSIRQYVLTTKEKHSNRNLPDNLIRINPNTCEIRGEGEVEFHTDMGQVDIRSYGNVIYNLKENELELDIVMSLDFFIADNCLDIIKDSIKKASDQLYDINLNRQKYIKAMRDLFGEDNSSLMMTELELTGDLRRFPDKLNHNFFFADIRLKWDQDMKSFISKGPIGLGNMNRTIYNKYVNGFFEYHKQRGGDILTFYFEPAAELGNSPGVPWFYFRYNRGVMQTISSVREYNATIRDIRTQRRRLDVERGETPYIYNLSPDYRPFSFFDRMKPAVEME